MKKPLKHNETICLYCGVENATWAMDLDNGEVKMTAPLCNACSNLPRIILESQLIGRIR